jgi:hypothetical protein
MLTLHSTRRLLSGSKLWVIICFLLVTVALIAAVVFDLCLINHPFALQNAGVVALAAISVLQLWLLWQVLSNPHETHQFYDRLSKQRKARQDEFVQSYRHMREHGNAVSIVIFELVLAFIFWSLRPLSSGAGNGILVGRVGLILAVWLTPAALVWLIGSSLERYLSRSNSDRTNR